MSEKRMKNLFLKTFKRMKERGWTKIYIAVDIHDTTLKANYKPGEICTEFFPEAEKAIQRLTKRADFKLVLYTCSHQDELVKYENFFVDHDIRFDFTNKNPEVVDLPGLGCFKDKFYFNLMFEDKAGFLPEVDWFDINEALDEIEEMERIEAEKITSQNTVENGTV